jgi:hypothetical protein
MPDSYIGRDSGYHLPLARGDEYFDVVFSIGAVRRATIYMAFEL